MSGSYRDNKDRTMLTRQMLRQAERRIKRDRFPFPEFAQKLKPYLLKTPSVIFQMRPPNRVFTNLLGNHMIYTIREFYEVLDNFEEPVNEPNLEKSPNSVESIE